MLTGTSSWKEQFTEALTVSGGDEDDEGGGEPAAPSTLDYLMHGLTILWKVLFAFVPPTGKCFEAWNEELAAVEEGGEIGGGGWFPVAVHLARL